MSRLAVVKALAEQLGYSRLTELETAAIRERPIPRRLIERLSAMGEDAEIGLTPRQREVMVLIACGFSEQEAAEELGITRNTLHTHLKNIHLRLGAHNRVEAINVFLERAS